MITRPSEYDPIYIKKVDAYLKSRQDRDYEYHKSRGSKSDSYEEKTAVKLPTIEGFAKYIGVTRKTLYNWEKEHDDFAAALEEIRVEQHNRLIDRSLEGTYNPVIAKLMLSHNFGYREKTDVTSDDKPINTFNDEQVDRIAERIAARGGANGDSPST